MLLHGIYINFAQFVNIQKLGYFERKQTPKFRKMRKSKNPGVQLPKLVAWNPFLKIFSSLL